MPDEHSNLMDDLDKSNSFFRRMLNVMDDLEANIKVVPDGQSISWLLGIHTKHVAKKK